MAKRRQKIEIEIAAQVKDINKNLTTVNRKISDLSKTVETKATTAFRNLRSTVLKAGAAFFAARGLIRGIEASIQAAGRQEEAIATLEQVMRSMGRYTPEASKRLQEYASALQDVTKYGDEAILEGMGFLQTYREISDEAMPKAIEVMLDLTALMQGDMRSAANMVGKAAMGLTAELRRVGITIDEDVAKSGDFIAILGEMEKQVGGVARAQAQTLTGSLQQMKNAIGDASEAFGMLISRDVIRFAKWIKKASEELNNFLSQLRPVGPEFDATTYEIQLWNDEIKKLQDMARSADFKALRQYWKDQGVEIKSNKQLLKLTAELIKDIKAEVLGLELGAEFEEANLAIRKSGESIEELLPIIEMWKEKLEGANNKIKETSVNLASSLSQAFSTVFDPAITGAESWKRVILQLLSLFQQVIISAAAVNKSLKWIFKPEIGIPAILAALAALEGAKAAVRSVKFSFDEGAILKQPVFSPLLRGGAIAGEAGPEAVIPLKGPNVLTEISRKLDRVVDAINQSPTQGIQIGTVLTTEQFYIDELQSIAKRIEDFDIG